MTDNDRIAALRAKAEGHESIEVGEYEDGLVVVIRNDLDTAEDLLNVRDPEAVVVTVCNVDDGEGQLCCPECNFSTGGWCTQERETEFESGYAGPRCPGPAPEGYEWVLTLRRKVEK